jgi:hypothetical protein
MKKENFGGVIDRVSACFTQFFQKSFEAEQREIMIMNGLTVVVLIATEEILDTKLMGKIVIFGLNKGVNDDEFVILRMYYAAGATDGNTMMQISTEAC